MENSSELCNALNRIITSANGKSKPALPSTPRPPTVQTADLLGFDVEGTVRTLPLRLSRQVHS
jgi:hypothetical protein